MHRHSMSPVTILPIAIITIAVNDVVNNDTVNAVVAAENERCEQGAALFPGPRPPLDEDHPLMLAQKEDLQALGGVFLELIFSSLGSGGPSESTSGPALQRLLVDVFKGNIDEFRCLISSEGCYIVGVVLSNIYRQQMSQCWHYYRMLVRHKA